MYPIHMLVDLILGLYLIVFLCQPYGFLEGNVSVLTQEILVNGDEGVKVLDIRWVL